mgnify:CR=1 FL=1
MPNDKCIIDPERDCIGKAAAAKLEARIESLERWQVDSKKFHNDFYDWQREQIQRDTRVDGKLENINNSLTKLLTWQETQQARPAKAWQTVLTAILTGVVGFLLAKFGMG